MTTTEPEEQKLGPDFRAKWVTALRSGDYTQGRFNLRNLSGLPDGEDDTFCCLGVACELMGLPWEIKGPNDTWGSYRFPHTTPEGNRLHTYSGSLPPEGWMDGLSLTSMETLSDMNDGRDDKEKIVRRHTFAEIADWIEENL